MILNHLYSMGFAEKLKVWVPHDLGENNKEKQIASQHLACHQTTCGHRAFCTESSQDTRNDAYI